MNKLDIRILQIDLARQIESIEIVKSYADFAKECGFNYILLYLEAAIRTPDTEYFYKDETYSMDEMKEIVNYIESIGLKVIPCFENLPHLEKFFRYKKLEHLSELYDEKTLTRGYNPSRFGSEGCPSNPELYKFFDKYFTDCMECFPNSEYVHMGLDEVFDLAHCDKCRERLNSGLTKKDIFYEHVIHTYNLCKSWGRTMMMWDDFFESVDIAERLPRDIIMVNWNYSFVGTEPGGHWIGRRKKDWFRYYDKLGFKYIFGVWAQGGSSTENVDTFTRYANKYSPIGGICTSWEKSDCFYHGTYPLVYYTSQLWLGNLKTEEDKINAMAYMLQGDKELAKLLLSNTIDGCGGGLDMLDVVENQTSGARTWLLRNKYFIEELKTFLPKMKGLSKDILTDIYDVAMEMYLISSFNDLGYRVFDAYETDGITDKFIKEVEKVEAEMLELESNAKKLWAKYRKNIKSQDDAFENKWVKYTEAFKKIKARLKENKKWGTFTGEYMLHDMYGTPNAKIVVKYVDGSEQVLYNSQLKPSLGSACFQVRYRMENKLIDSMTFTASGEGACYPSYFYYVVDNKKYIVDTVEKVEGNCERIEKILENDSGFAILGYEDALKCFNDIDSTKELHTIKVKFKEL